MKTSNLRNIAVLLTAFLLGAQIPAHAGATAKTLSAEPEVLHVLDGTASNGEKNDGVTLVLVSEDGKHFRALGGYMGKTLFGRIDASGVKTNCPAEVIERTSVCYQFDGSLYLGDDGSGFPVGTKAGLHLAVKLNAGKGTGDYRIAPIANLVPQIQHGTLDLPQSSTEPDASLQLAQSLHQANEHKAAFAVYERLLAKYPDNAGIYWQRGMWYQQLKNESAANADYRRVNQLKPDFADAWGSLGWNLILQGDLAEAQKVTRKAQELASDDYANTVNLGHTFLLQGDASAAQGWYQKTLPLIPDENALKSGPLADFDLFISKGWQVEASSRARDWFEQSWPQLQRATQLNQQGIALYRQGKYREAAALFQQTLAIREKQLGTEHPSTATILNNLAELYRAMGQYSEALPLHRRALAIREKQLGHEHPYTGQSLNNLAMLYQSMGQYSEALPLYQHALAISEKANGPDHPDTATSLDNLAGLYASMGHYSEALPLHQRALAISEKASGPDHPDTATSLNNLAALYKSMGQYSEALPLYRRALAISEKAEGPDHPSTATSLNNLAGLYKFMGQYSKALPLYRRALAIREKQLGAEHPSTAASLNNLAALYESMGQYSEALPLLLRAWRIAATAGVPELVWHVQSALSSFYAETQPELAIWYGKQAVNTLQAARVGNTGLDKAMQKSFLEKNEATYKDLADLLFTQGRLIEGQQVLAMLKEAEYFDSVQRNSATDPRKTRAGFDGREKPLADDYDRISGQLVTLSKEREALQKREEASMSAADKARLVKLDADLTLARQAYDAFTVELLRELGSQEGRAASDARRLEVGGK